MVLASRIAPASRSRAAGGASSSSGTGRLAAVPSGVGVPRVAISSFSVTGTPSSGPAVPRCQRSVDAAASAIAASGS